jgi:hypothetical protein
MFATKVIPAKQQKVPVSFVPLRPLRSFNTVSNQKKAPRCGAFLFDLSMQSHIDDVMIQATFMTRSLVSVDKTFVCHAINRGNGVLESSFRCRLVAFFYGVVNILDVSTHHSAHAHVMGATGNGLTGAFSCSG